MPPSIPRERLTAFARAQRTNPVQAEAIMWRMLRDRRCEGAKFQRQAPLGPYIVDFVCFAARLVVEIDGPSHLEEAQVRSDIARDSWLRTQAFRVLRLPNDLVIASTELALQQIVAELGKTVP